MIIWVAIGAGTLACYLAKLAGLSLPARLLDRPRVRRVAALLPIALLAALTAIQTVSTGARLVVDPRLAGVAAGAVALLLRAPFIVVVAVAAATAALMRLW
jgi:Branched-chain amino acid transport protein (AzlD)